MRLMELGTNRPIRAGKAVLEYVKPDRLDTKVPFRKRTHIVLPDFSDLELLQLQEDWNQFLIVLQDAVWFGGTDENPFLVEMNRDCLQCFFRGGREGFYRDLVPTLITELVQEFGGEYIRQGDIFAWPVPFSWREIEKAHRIVYTKRLKMLGTQKQQVFGTRHTLVGKGFGSPLRLLGRDLQAVVEGTLTAPDHSPRELKGPHVLAQTRLLWHPQSAD